VPPLLYYPVWRLIIVSVLSFSMFEAVWAYRNWRYVIRALPRSANPVLRAIFSGVTLGPLARDLRTIILRVGGHSTLNPVMLGISYFVLNVLWRLPGVWCLLGIISIVPVLVIQNQLNAVARAAGSEHAQAPGIRLGEWLSVAAVWIFVIGVAAVSALRAAD
jgi:hypothetical protein